MARTGGWTRRGSKSRGFRYYDGKGREITDDAILERIDELRIPPAWRTCGSRRDRRRSCRRPGTTRPAGSNTSTAPSIAPSRSRPSSTSSSASASVFPDIRAAMSADMDRDPLDRERVAAVALRLINLGWFRPDPSAMRRNHARSGSPRYARVTSTSAAIGCGSIFAPSTRCACSALVDAELADEIRS